MATITINKKDVIWSYLGTFFRISTNILLLPVLVYFLTEEELGLWYVFASIAQFVVLFDFGFTPTFARNISYIWSGASHIKKESVVTTDEKDTNWYEFKAILKTCSSIYAIIATIGLVLLLSFGSYYVIRISSYAHLNSWLIYCVAVFFNIYYGYYTSFLSGIGAVAENHKAAILSKLIQLVFSTLLLFYGLGLLGVSIAYLLSGLSLRIISKYYFNKYEDIGNKIKNILVENIYRKCFTNVRIIWKNASRDGLVTLSNFLTTQANTLLCSSVIGLEATGSYGLSLQIATLISSISSIPFSSFQAKMQGNAVKGDMHSNVSVFSRAILLYICVFIFLGIFSFIAFPILNIIKPDFNIDKIIYIFILIQTLLYGYYNLYASFISCYNLIPYTETYIITSVSSVILSFIFAKYTDLSIWSLVLIPTIISLYNVYKWPSYVRNNIIQINRKQFLYEGIIGFIDMFHLHKYNKKG